ncbi:MAG: acyclic terpene utilization AtuA family protein [Geminicoccaceae bacterium]
MSIRIYCPTGAFGLGFLDSSLERAVSMKPDVIACDGGSTDSGPFYLGAGQPKMSREALVRDLRRLLVARDRLQVPLIIGSCGTSGIDAMVDMMRDLAVELACELGLSFRLATIHGEQDREETAARFDRGCIQALPGAPSITRDDILACEHIVGMMGVEPIQAALEGGADVVLAGRATDTALFAAMPLMRGLPPGPVWHCAKTIECGAICSTKPVGDGVIADIDETGFEVEPASLEAACTPLGIAAHTLYENADPILIHEPGGTLNTGGALYTALDSRRTRVEGSTFEHAPCTIKLEGSALGGYQTIAIGGVRDPLILRQLESWTDGMMAFFDTRVKELTGLTLGKEVLIDISFYGRDAVMGKTEPLAGEVGHEVGMLFTVTAPTQKLANTVCRFVTHMGSHWSIPEWDGFISAIAFPFSPPEIDRGPVYRFKLHHVATDIRPDELFRTQFEEVGR